MNFLVLDRSQAQRFVYGAPYAVVSITDPEARPAEILRPDYCKGILRVAFHDMMGPIGDADQQGLRLITPMDALAIVRFARRYAHLSLLMIHCEAGISRSAAVAGALDILLGGDAKWAWTHFLPNPLVFRHVLLAGGKEPRDYLHLVEYLPNAGDGSYRAQRARVLSGGPAYGKRA